MERALALDRDCRRQVRKVFYLRRPNFDSDRAYNDYLEQVEDLVEQLVEEATRPAARAKLEQLRGQWAAQTADNLAAHDAERRHREDVLEQEREDALQAAQARHDAEQAQLAAAEKARKELQDKIAVGAITVHNAREDLKKAAEAALAVPILPVKLKPPPPEAARYLAAAAAAAAPPEQTMVQPLDAAAAKALEAPAFMLPAVKAQADAYEADPVHLEKVRAAAAYDRNAWRTRYREEALCIEGLMFECARAPSMAQV